MNKYIDAEKLITEIDRRMTENCKLAEKAKCFGDRAVEDNDILALIASLQQEQPIQVNTLTWRDINDLERIINNVHYEFRSGIGEKSFGEEVLERFREERDEQEQPKLLTAKDAWRNMRLEAYAQASGANYFDEYAKIFSLCDIDEIFEEIGDAEQEHQEQPDVNFEEESEDKCPICGCVLDAAGCCGCCGYGRR